MRGVGRWAAVLALLLCGEAARAQQEEDPALTYLESGMANYEAGQYSLAARDLRIARFMSLSTPSRHLEIIARLAVAEDAAGTISARDASLDRFLEVEGLFPEYEAASLEPEARERFRAIVLKRYPRDRILAMPALAEELGLIPRTRSGRRPTATRPAANTPYRLPTATRTPGPAPDAAVSSERLPAPPTVSATGAAIAPATETETPAPSPTGTATAALSPTMTATPTARPTALPTATPTPSATRTATAAPTATATPAPTGTATATATVTVRPSATRTPTSTSTATPTQTRPAPTATATPTATPSSTATAAPTATSTRRPSATVTATATASATATATVTASSTSTPTATSTGTATSTRTATPSSTATRTPTNTRTSTASPTQTRTPLPSPTPAPVFVAPRTVDVAPLPIERIMPVYPERALKERVRGAVTLRVLVSETGTPLRAEVEKGVRADVDDAAVSAAMQWRFEAARKGGRPVRTYATVRFSFEGVQFARTPFPQQSSPGALPTATPRPGPG